MKSRISIFTIKISPSLNMKRHMVIEHGSFTCSNVRHVCIYITTQPMIKLSLEKATNAPSRFEKSLKLFSSQPSTNIIHDPSNVLHEKEFPLFSWETDKKTFPAKLQGQDRCLFYIDIKRCIASWFRQICTSSRWKRTTQLFKVDKGRVKTRFVYFRSRLWLLYIFMYFSSLADACEKLVVPIRPVINWRKIEIKLSEPH